jgi:hypothetical protein
VIDTPEFTLLDTDILPFSDLFSKITLHKGKHQFSFPSFFQLPFNVPASFAQTFTTTIYIDSGSKYLGCVSFEKVVSAIIATPDEF